MIDTNKDCSLQHNFDWRLTNKQCNYSSKNSRNKSVLSKGSLISLATQKKRMEREGGGGRGGDEKQNSRLLQFLFKELPSKGDDAVPLTNSTST